MTRESSIYILRTINAKQRAMDSSLNRLKESQQKADDIRRKIALLQAQLVDAQGSINHTLEQPTSPKRKRPHFTVLAPSTPSPSTSVHLSSTFRYFTHDFLL